MEKTKRVVDVTEATFERDVLERSQEVPVVVDFWAEWCGPCRALSPVLEKLAAEAGGAWVLAKIDVDSNPNLAAAAGVMGIPSVRAFKDGRQVAEFTGALPESQVRAWVRTFGPSDADRAFEEAMAAHQHGNLDAASDALRRVLALEPGHERARRLLAQIELSQRAEELDEEELTERLTRDPTNIDVAIALADLEAKRGDLSRAFERLVESVRTAEGEDRQRARIHLLTLLDTVPADDPVAASARRALSLALF